MNTDRCIAVIQARMGSTRLPGKVLADVHGLPMLRRVIERVRESRDIDDVIVATGCDPIEQPIHDACRRWGVSVWGGCAVDDVLGRFACVSRGYGAARVVRVCGDTPLVDFDAIDWLLSVAETTGADYVGYHGEDGTPTVLTSLGLFPEVVSAECLQRADATITDPAEREHVTLGIYTRPQDFRCRWLRLPAVCDDESLRFAVDTADDLHLMQQIVARVGTCTRVEQLVATVRECPEWLESMAGQPVKRMQLVCEAG